MKAREFRANEGVEDWQVIGSVNESGDETAVTVNGSAYAGPTGWTHF